LSFPCRRGSSRARHQQAKPLADLDGQPFLTWEDFCQHPEPYGLGLSPDQVEVILDRSNAGKRLSAVLGEHGGDRGNQHTGGKRQGCARNLATRGTAEHWRLRLAREAPTDPKAAALWDQVRVGNIKPTTAAKRMGWRRKPTRLDELRRAWRRTSAEDRRTFLAEISGHEEKPEA
jgi:hypothetical protein